MGLPSASRKRTPSALAIPTPPSLVAEPPSPISTFSAPLSMASRMTWPTPSELARRAFSLVCSMSVMPDASAISMTAQVPPTMP